MMLGAITSTATYFSGAINKFSVTMASVPVLSIEFLYIVFTAFVTGMAGAFGGWFIRKMIKLFSRLIFTGKKDERE